MLLLSSGKSDAHAKKPSGVRINAKSDEKAVRVTDKARFPFANSVKKFEALPPGQAATSIIPSANPGEGSNKKIRITVISGSKKYCDRKPVSKAFLLWRNW